MAQGIVERRADNRRPSDRPAGPSRRNFCVLLAGAWFNGPAAAGAGADPILIVSAAGTDAYAQAVDGIRAGLTATVPVALVDLSLKQQSDSLARTLAAKRPRLIIAVGAEAIEAVNACPADAPVIHTMTLLSDTLKSEREKSSPPSAIGGVSLDLPLAAVCREWKQLVPGKTRLGVIRNPRKNGPAGAAMETQALSAGCSARIVDCARPEELVAAFLSFRNHAEFVWCMPDSTLYTSATVRPLLSASLEEHLPLVGFSESFVRAGAIMGVYPDFKDVGLQTAELAKRWLAGDPLPPAQTPRIVRVTFNHRVARLMGLRYTAPPEGDGRVAVLK